MIATHTFNPSVDITYMIDPIEVGGRQSCETENQKPRWEGD